MNQIKMENNYINRNFHMQEGKGRLLDVHDKCIVKTYSDVKYV